MPTQATASRNVVINRDGAPVGEVINFTGPGLSLNLVDVTSLDFDWQQFISVYKMGGQATLTINYVPDDSVHQQIISDIINETTQVWAFVMPGTGNPTWSGPAYVQTFEPTGAADGQLQGNLTLQFTDALSVST